MSQGLVLTIGAGAQDASNEVIGPGVAVDSNIAVYDTDGEHLKDSGTSIAAVIAGAVGGSGNVAGPGSASTDHLPTFANTSGKVLKDSGQSVASVIAAGAAAAPQGDFVGPAGATTDHVLTFSSGTGKAGKDGGKTIADIIAAASVAPPSAIAQNSFLISGGSLIWTSAYNFRVSAAAYYIGGLPFTSTEQTVTLSASDASLDRIDVIAVNTSGTVVAVAGTAAAQPSEPDVDPASQLKLGVVLVTHNTSAPVGATITTLFTEDAGGPGEWNWTTVGVGFTLNSTNNPHGGTKDIEGTNVAKSAYIQAAIPSGTIEVNAYDSLVLYIRSKAAWANNRALKIQWYVSGTAKGTALNLADGFFGFNSSNITTYQLVVIPLSQFAVPVGTGVNQLRITDTNGAIGFYLDDITLQQGISSSLAISALTQNQADARYASLIHGSQHNPLTGTDKITAYRKVGISIGSGSAAITTGVKGSIQVDFPGTIIGWSIQADQSGSISVDVCKKAGTQIAPVVPNTTTDKISASAPVALSSAQALGVLAASLTGWTTAVAQWDSILFNVTSAVTITRATLWLLIQQN